MLFIIVGSFTLGLIGLFLRARSKASRLARVDALLTRLVSEMDLSKLEAGTIVTSRIGPDQITTVHWPVFTEDEDENGDSEP